MTTVFSRSIMTGLLVSCFLCTSTYAMDMEKMMQQAEAAQACFEKIDESQLQALEQQGRKMEQEINALCKAGKPSEATSKALEYSLKMQKDPSFKQIQECSSYMEGMMPALKPYMAMAEGGASEASTVCD